MYTFLKIALSLYVLHILHSFVFYILTL